MDGKKRIARLRNAEKWKALGFGAPIQKKDRLKIVKAVKEKIIAIPALGMAKLYCSCPICRAPKPEAMAEGKPALSNPYSYQKWLQKKGWKRLGNGVHSTVYGREDSEKVIKVTTSLDNWIDYVQWAAKEGYAGNLAPKVYSWKRRDNWSVAVVEKMYKGGYDADQKDDGMLLMNLTYPARKGNLLAQCFMEDIQPGSVRFFKELSANKFDGDVGGNNFMFRKDGSLCLTDPCAGSIKTTLKRLRSGELSPTLW